MGAGQGRSAAHPQGGALRKPPIGAGPRSTTGITREKRWIQAEPEVVVLDRGWEAARTEPGACPGPEGLGALDWLPAAVPGTAAAALRNAGRWSPGDPHDFDGEDWWFRVRFAATGGAAATLHLDGVATLHEVFLNGVPVVSGSSMFERHAAPVDLRADNELAIRCRALAPELAISRKPRARWRQQVTDGNLRWFRTMLLGRAPGFAPGPAAVGPWRPVRVVLAPAGGTPPQLDVRTSLRDGAGVAAITVRSAAAVTVSLSGHGAERTWQAPAGGGASELVIDAPALWWPHTHGDPARYDLRMLGPGGEVLAERRVGFRSIAPGAAAGHDVERDGLDLHVNGVRVFARGAVWTPVDPVGMAPGREDLRAALHQVRDGGLNLVRVVGTGAYESADFHDLCDELGILVWQDFMFANLDYPVADDGFRAAVAAEAATVAGDLAWRPSTVVLCGNSEVEQQVGMLGLDPALGRGELFGELLPGALAEAGSDAIYVPSAPCGGDQPFRTDAGVANYFGVGGYRRPLEDARRASVRFASECLAIANVPDDATLAAMGLQPSGDLFDDPRWKAAVTSDQGTDWDFDDVRDHYLALLFGADPAALRREDRERYLQLSRQVSGEVMAEVFGEWRRGGSPCGGGIVLWLRDLVPGAGWGLIDATCRPKAAWHHLRRVLAPVAVWTTDEGQNGIGVHVANDRPEPLRARLRVAVYREQHRVADGVADVDLAPHATATYGAEALIGRFVDIAYAFRFGPPGHDTVVTTLEQGDAVVSQAFRFPAGRPAAQLDVADLGLTASARRDGDELQVTLACDRVLYGARLEAPGWAAADDAFNLEPGRERTVALKTGAPPAPAPGGIRLTALNLSRSLTIGVA